VHFAIRYGKSPYSRPRWNRICKKCKNVNAALQAIQRRSQRTFKVSPTMVSRVQHREPTELIDNADLRDPRQNLVQRLGERRHEGLAA
jgi:hypothetical protein